MQPRSWQSSRSRCKPWIKQGGHHPEPGRGHPERLSPQQAWSQPASPSPGYPGLTEERRQVRHGLQEGQSLDLLISRQRLELVFQQQRHDQRSFPPFPLTAPRLRGL